MSISGEVVRLRPNELTESVHVGTMLTNTDLLEVQPGTRLELRYVNGERVLLVSGERVTRFSLDDVPEPSKPSSLTHHITLWWGQIRALFSSSGPVEQPIKGIVQAGSHFKVTGSHIDVQYFPDTRTGIVTAHAAETDVTILASGEQTNLLPGLSVSIEGDSLQMAGEHVVSIRNSQQPSGGSSVANEESPPSSPHSQELSLKPSSRLNYKIIGAGAAIAVGGVALLATGSSDSGNSIDLQDKIINQQWKFGGTYPSGYLDFRQDFTVICPPTYYGASMNGNWQLHETFIEFSCMNEEYAYLSEYYTGSVNTEGTVMQGTSTNGVNDSLMEWQAYAQ